MTTKFRRYFLSSLMAVVSAPMSLSAGSGRPADPAQPRTLVLDVALETGTLVIDGFVYPVFWIRGGSATASFTPADAPATASTHVFALANTDSLATQGDDGGYPQIRTLLGGTGHFSGAIRQVCEDSSKQ
jgi:hypothetical protein